MMNQFEKAQRWAYVALVLSCLSLSLLAVAYALPDVDPKDAHIEKLETALRNHVLHYREVGEGKDMVYRLEYVVTPARFKELRELLWPEVVK